MDECLPRAGGVEIGDSEKNSPLEAVAVGVEVDFSDTDEDEDLNVAREVLSSTRPDCKYAI